jgi:hypothetical protein
MEGRTPCDRRDMVDNVPGPPADPNIRLTPVFRAGNPAVIALAKSLLDGEGIEYFVRAEALQDLFGWGRTGVGFSIVAGPAEFVVREEDAARARELLRDLMTSSAGGGTPESG